MAHGGGGSAMRKLIEGIIIPAFNNPMLNALEDQASVPLAELLTHGDLDPVHSFGSGEVCLLSVEAPIHLVGRTVANLTIPGEIIVAALTRDGRASIPAAGTQFRAGDALHLVVLASAMERLEALLGLGASAGG